MNDKELQQLVEEISLNVFQKPFKHRALFNRRLRTTGGRYLLRSHNIEVNPKYYEVFGRKELIGIIKHELCHYHLHLEGKGYRHRDADFRQLLKQVNAPRFCSTLPNSTNKKTTTFHLYACLSCGLQYKRKRNIDITRYVCGRCRGKLKKLK